MARKKSVNDIYNQYRRIIDSNVSRSPDLSDPTARSRADKALAAFNKYVGNIGKKKSMQKKWVGDKKFSQSTYMGLSNG